MKTSKDVLVVVQLAPIAAVADKEATIKSNDALMSQAFATLSAADPSLIGLLTAITESPASYGARSLSVAKNQQLVVECVCFNCFDLSLVLSSSLPFWLFLSSAVYMAATFWFGDV
jgi:hypothetical protein